MKNEVLYFDTREQYKTLKKQLDRNVLDVLKSGKYILGDVVQDFEAQFAKYCGSRYGVGVGSGNDALIFALKSLGIGKGDEVIVPSFTFVATVFAIMHVGATPVFVDVDLDTYTMDSTKVLKEISKKTRALLPVHLYGQCAPMGELLSIAKKYNLVLIEDAAQAHGAKWKNRLSGSMGDAGCFSFYPTKNLGACGDGGMVITKHKSAFESIRRYRNLGRSDMRDHQEAAWTSRLDSIQAALLQVKLTKLDKYNANRRSIASLYKQELAKTPLKLPVEAPGRYHVYHLFVILVPDGKRDSLRDFLARRGIPTMVHYPKPVHRQPAYTKVYSNKWKLPVTDKLSAEILSLPIYPEMKTKQVRLVAKEIKNFYG